MDAVVDALDLEGVEEARHGRVVGAAALSARLGVIPAAASASRHGSHADWTPLAA
jgi:hypothetical protein